MRKGLPGYDIIGDESDLLIEDMFSMLSSQRQKIVVEPENVVQLPPGAKRAYAAMPSGAHLQREVIECLFKHGTLTKTEIAELLQTRRESIQMTMNRLSSKNAVSNTKDKAGFAHWFLI